MVEHLATMHKVLNSIPSFEKQKKKKKQKNQTAGLAGPICDPCTLEAEAGGAGPTCREC